MAQNKYKTGIIEAQSAIAELEKGYYDLDWMFEHLIRLDAYILWNEESSFQIRYGEEAKPTSVRAKDSETWGHGYTMTFNLTSPNKLPIPKVLSELKNTAGNSAFTIEGNTATLNHSAFVKEWVKEFGMKNGKTFGYRK